VPLERLGQIGHGGHRVELFAGEEVGQVVGIAELGAAAEIGLLRGHLELEDQHQPGLLLGRLLDAPAHEPPDLRERLAGDRQTQADRPADPWDRPLFPAGGGRRIRGQCRGCRQSPPDSDRRSQNPSSDSKASGHPAALRTYPRTLTDTGLTTVVGVFWDRF